VCRVACLAWCGADRGCLPPGAKAKAKGELPFEISIAKEAKEPVRLWWKTPRLSDAGHPGRRRITVRTQWQSGHPVGDTGAGALKGNRLIGNERQPPEKFHPT